MARISCLAASGSLGACTLGAPIAAPPTSPSQMLREPSDLIGSTPQVLTAEFGQPALLRVDGPDQIWLYHSDSCGLNLILYPDAAGVPRVAMATAADGGTAIGACPASLEQSHFDLDLNPPASAAMRGPAAIALEPPASS